nr:MAG: polyprotein [Yellow silver pine badnavirus 5]
MSVRFEQSIREWYSQSRTANLEYLDLATTAKPTLIGLFDEVITRWESITLNFVNSKSWSSNQEKVDFIENLLGMNEKTMWIQWRMNYSVDYENLVAQAEDTRNITSQIRRICTLEDPYQGSTEQQNRAYIELERLTCPDMKSIFQYMTAYWKLASETGRAFISPELSDKFFLKMPPIIGKELQEAFMAKYPGAAVGILPRVHFSFQYLSDMCKRAAMQRSLKDLSFCSTIPIPDYYRRSTKKYGLRKSKTYKGKPHETHIRTFKRKDGRKQSKCKCFICGEEGHFARDCKRQKGNIARKAILDNLDLPEDYDVLSVDQNESDSEGILSMSEGEDGFLNSLREEALMLRVEEDAELEQQPPPEPSKPKKKQKKVKYPLPDYMPIRTPPDHVCKCEKHMWYYNLEVTDHKHAKCSWCKIETRAKFRIHCPECTGTACYLCAKYFCQILLDPATIDGKPSEKAKAKKELEKSDTLESELLKKNVLQEIEIRKLKKELEDLKAENQRLRLEQDLQTSYADLLQANRNQKAESSRGQLISLTSSSEEENFAVLQEYTKEISADGVSRKKKRVVNRLYNFRITFSIPTVPEFSVQAILDTGATCCCINSEGIPKEAQTPSGFITYFNGVNSRTPAEFKVKDGFFEIAENKFKIPLIYSFPMDTLADGIQMLLGCNFIRSLQGGCRIEGNVVTIYKQVTPILTEPDVEMVELVELDYDEMINVNHAILTTSEEKESVAFRQRNQQLLDNLKDQGFIGEEPMKHWGKNQVKCKLEIINPDITIQDRPLKHVTPAMSDTFQKHVAALLQIGVIRPSKSRHRTMAMMVSSGTTIDPITKAEVRGKERMVFNYKSLNDNTFKDQYSLPGINTILQKIGNSKIYSKFDLKSGFHQVAMAEESIEWTVFITSTGLYEWLVMPFGLKNAPSVFQRKMDHCFAGTSDFIAVYIDDILVFSENEKAHEKHLRLMLDICVQHGLVLSPSKMKIATTRINFLGADIGEGKIRLQEHIIKKIVDFNDELLKSKKGLRSWLGILNYARAYIPNLGKLLGPLYTKTSPHGDQRMKESDWAIVRQIKEMVTKLPDMQIPPAQCHIVLEVDGCMEGWGGICKWKPAKADPRTTEKICAYASGKFSTVKSTIDSEIHACMESLSAFKIYYLDKGEITLRTDCQAIIAFFNKSVNNKPSRVRWLNFVDYVTGNGINVLFEHIDGKLNLIADALSRLVNRVYKYSSPETDNLCKELEYFIQFIEGDNSLSATRKDQIYIELQQCLLKALNGSEHIMAKTVSYHPRLSNMSTPEYQEGTKVQILSGGDTPQHSKSCPQDQKPSGLKDSETCKQSNWSISSDMLHRNSSGHPSWVTTPRSGEDLQRYNGLPETDIPWAEVLAWTPTT